MVWESALTDYIKLSTLLAGACLEQSCLSQSPGTKLSAFPHNQKLNVTCTSQHAAKYKDKLLFLGFFFSHYACDIFCHYCKLLWWVCFHEIFLSTHKIIMVWIEIILQFWLTLRIQIYLSYMITASTQVLMYNMMWIQTMIIFKYC